MAVGDAAEVWAAHLAPATGLDHLDPGTLLVLDEPGDIAEAAAFLWRQADERRAELVAAGELPKDWPSTYLAAARLEEPPRRVADARADLGIGPPEDVAMARGGLSSGDPFGWREPVLPPGRAGRLAAAVEAWRADGARIVLASDQAPRLAELLGEAGHAGRRRRPARGGATAGRHRPHRAQPQRRLRRRPGRARLRHRSRAVRDGPGPPPEGAAAGRAARHPRAADAGRPRRPHRPRRRPLRADAPARRRQGEERDYLELSFAGGDRIFVPVEQIGRVSRYSGGERPALSKLGGTDWLRTKAARPQGRRRPGRGAARAVRVARRRARPRLRPDTPWQSEMEASFPYEETIDQLRAAAEVKADMELIRPMDRLVVGDVGYGKTEVALRAAFKATQDGKQVAVLVPTTVLAAQHYATFRQRFAAFPLEVRLLSRFVPPADAGGDHRRPRRRDGRHRHRDAPAAEQGRPVPDLGLVVVDEEQRFGVAAKERLKQLKREVDVLTLSATPIPRTLNLALAGDPRPVASSRRRRRTGCRSRPGSPRRRPASSATRSCASSTAAARSSTSTTGSRRSRPRPSSSGGCCPASGSSSAHGQMAEGELEKVMITFADGAADVLVCTTIIESGLDIPNANTIVIDRADTLGLAQLYQLRGRVGRSSRRAYAYLLYRRRERLSDEARKRLQAIFNASELGRRLPDRAVGPRDPRRRQHPGRRAVRAHGGGRLRPLLAAAGRGGRGRARRRWRAGRRSSRRRRPSSTCRSRRTCPTTTSPTRPRSSSCTGGSPGPGRPATSPRSARRSSTGSARCPTRSLRLVEVAELRLAAEAAGVASISREEGWLVVRFGAGLDPGDGDAPAGRAVAAGRPPDRRHVRHEPGPDPAAGGPAQGLDAHPGRRRATVRGLRLTAHAGRIRPCLRGVPSCTQDRIRQGGVPCVPISWSATRRLPDLS